MDKIRQDIWDSVEKIPAFSHSVQQIQKLSSDINCDSAQLVKVIEYDPVLVLKILKMVNSSYFGLAKKITSVNHAVLYLGLNTIKNLALSIAILGVMPRKNAAGFNMDAFLMHSLATATVSRMLAKKSGIPEKELFDYFLSGLLHDFGKIVLARYLPGEYKETLRISREETIPLFEVERQIFGVNHAVIGSLLMEKWQILGSINEALKNHHNAADDNFQMRDFIITADQISKELKIGYSGSNVIECIPQKILAQFGGDINQIIVSLGDIRTEVEKATLFAK
ncbi:MAG: HDOD domain-containing protein [Smithella sp.]